MQFPKTCKVSQISEVRSARTPLVCRCGPQGHGMPCPYEEDALCAAVPV
jgi:hypothetical protein